MCSQKRFHGIGEDYLYFREVIIRQTHFFQGINNIDLFKKINKLYIHYSKH